MVRGSLGLALLISLAASLGAAAIALAQAAGPRTRLETLNVRETVLTTEQGNNLNRLARLLTVLEQFRRDPPPALLVSPQDATDAVRAAILVKAITPELQRRARVYAAEAGEIARQRRLAAVASEALFTTDSEMADQRPGDAAMGGVDAPLARLPPPVDRTVVTPPARLMAPAQGPVLHSFGARLTGGGRSNGITLQTAAGAPVQAPEDGTVQYVGPVKGWGVILILRLSGGYHLVLAGMERAKVSVGQSVAAGAPVGWMSDGRQSPSELYLEIRERGVPVDPARWLKANAG